MCVFRRKIVLETISENQICDVPENEKSYNFLLITILPFSLFPSFCFEESTIGGKTAGLPFGLLKG